MRRRLALGAIMLAAVAFACGLDALTPPSDAITSDASTIEETSTSSDGSQGGADAPASDAGADATTTTSVDAADADANADADADANADAKPICKFTRVVDPLAVLDGGVGGWVVAHDVSNGDHPKIDPSPEGPAVSLISANATSSVGGIWRSPMGIHAFDVSFRYIITCASLTSCADGVAAMWVESRDGGPPELFPSLSGSTFGMPGPGVRGGAVAFDVHKDVGTNDPATPCVSILSIDPLKSPGTYDWHVVSGPANNGIVGAHDVSIRVRKSSVSVMFDGVTTLSATVSTTNFVGWFGVGASTGSNVGTFFVRNFDGTFYECDEP